MAGAGARAAEQCHKTAAHTHKDVAFINLQVIVGESLNRSIIIAICEDLILFYSSGSMDYLLL